MSDRTIIKLPIGRLVMGSLYKPETTDFNGKPLTEDDGKTPKVEYWIRVAIAKGTETHWNQTPWGQIIWNEAVKAFPDGRYNNRTFYWKVTDGDSTEVNGNGNRPCDTEGFAGNWILHFKTKYAPILCNLDGSLFTMPENAIKLGYYIQVYGSVVANVAPVNPGMLLFFSHVAFAGYGQEIQKTYIDPKSIGFGGALPAGCSPVPLGLAPSQAVPVASAPMPAPTPAPYTPILNPRVMTTKANGLTYEQYKAAGWTDEQLIQNGMMTA